MSVDRETTERWAQIDMDEKIKRVEEKLREVNGEVSILEMARKRVETAPEDYGPPAENAERIAYLWQDYILGKFDVYIKIDAVDVALMMVLLKVAREEANSKRDNLVDIAGWAAVADASRR